MEECCLQACYPWLDVFLFHLKSQAQWAEPTHINHSSSKRPTGLPTGQSDRDIPSVKVPSSQVILA